jgi:hypothetical protein
MRITKYMYEWLMLEHKNAKWEEMAFALAVG